MPAAIQLHNYSKNNTFNKTQILIRKELNECEFFNLFGEIFNFFHGKIPNLFLAYIWYPDCLNYEFNLMYELLEGEGPLPIEWRYYIAIMVYIININLFKQK